MGGGEREISCSISFTNGGLWRTFSNELPRETVCGSGALNGKLLESGETGSMNPLTPTQHPWNRIMVEGRVPERTEQSQWAMCLFNVHCSISNPWFVPFLHRPTHSSSVTTQLSSPFGCLLGVFCCTDSKFIQSSLSFSAPPNPPSCFSHLYSSSRELIYIICKWIALACSPHNPIKIKFLIIPLSCSQ